MKVPERPKSRIFPQLESRALILEANQSLNVVYTHKKPLFFNKYVDKPVNIVHKRH